MQYLADILTLSRLLICILFFIWTGIGGEAGWAFIIFAVGELTDAFDGTLASRHPFPKDKTPKYRKYSAVIDMVADILLAFALALYFIVRVNLVAGLIITIGYIVIAVVIELIVYGRMLGHPDTARPNSLMVKNFPLSKKIILARRNLYLASLFVVATWTLYASTWPLLTKITITIVGVIVCVFLWGFLSQRRHNISRDAIEIERKLSQKSPSTPSTPSSPSTRKPSSPTAR